MEVCATGRVEVQLPPERQREAPQPVSMEGRRGGWKNLSLQTSGKFRDGFAGERPLAAQTYMLHMYHIWGTTEESHGAGDVDFIVYWFQTSSQGSARIQLSQEKGS